MQALPEFQTGMKNTRELKPVSVTQIYGPYIFLLCGMVIAFVTFIFELEQKLLYTFFECI